MIKTLNSIFKQDREKFLVPKSVQQAIPIQTVSAYKKSIEEARTYEQMSYITNADAGCGLIKYGSSLVPFINKFPKNTRLYKLMTTKPGGQCKPEQDVRRIKSKE